MGQDGTTSGGSKQLVLKAHSVFSFGFTADSQQASSCGDGLDTDTCLPGIGFDLTQAPNTFHFSTLGRDHLNLGTAERYYLMKPSRSALQLKT